MITKHNIQIEGKAGNLVMYFNYGFRTIENGKTKYRPFKLSIGKSIDLKNWDSSTHLPTPEFSTKDKFRLHNTIESTIDTLNQALTELTVNSDYAMITPEILREKYEEKTGKKKVVQTVNHDIKELIHEYIKKNDLADNTKKGYYSTIVKLEEYSKKNGVKLNLNNFTQSHFDSFLGEMRQEGLKANSVWKYQKTMNAIIGFASDKGAQVRVKRSKAFKQTERLKVVLSFKQIEQIIDFKTKNEAQENHKNLLLILLFTGCRIGDLPKMLENDSYTYDDDNNQYISYCSDKSDTHTVVPVFKPIAHLVKHTSFSSDRKVKMISEQKLREGIKAILKQIFGEERVNIKGISLAITDFHPHCARASYITNLMSLMTIPVHLIQQSTGHAVDYGNDAFSTYAQIDNFQLARLLRKSVVATEHKLFV